MMHVDEQPQPSDFASRVSTRGAKFLAKTPHPADKQWRSHDYWIAIKVDLYEVYGGICNFVCHWIPPDTGSITVEHFKPKHKYPKEAYKWSNFRLMCGTLNGRKGIHEDVLDPFKIDNGMFVIDFPSLLVKPSDTLNAAQAAQVRATISRLKLNDEGTCVKARERYVKRYCKGMIDFALLKCDSPFLAYELERQDLVEGIRTIMVYSS
jgi:hypothetical protein